MSIYCTYILAPKPEHYRHRFSVKSAFISPYTKALMLPRLRFPHPPNFTTPFCHFHPRIHCATSPIINHLPDSTTLPLPLSNFRAVRPLLTGPADSPDASPCHSASGGSTISRQVEDASVIPGPLLQSDPTTSSEIANNSQVPSPASESPGRTSPRPKDASPPGAIADILPVAALSHPPEGTMQRDIVHRTQN